MVGSKPKTLRADVMQSSVVCVQYILRYKVLTAVTVKIIVFWVVAPCSLVVRHQCFGGTCCLNPLLRIFNTVLAFSVNTTC
jgi:hypothetical protein